MGLLVSKMSLSSLQFLLELVNYF